jgi:hypothetical protein
MNHKVRKWDQISQLFLQLRYSSPGTVCRDLSPIALFLDLCKNFSAEIGKQNSHVH